jgi:hypothetical protein
MIDFRIFLFKINLLLWKIVIVSIILDQLFNMPSLVNMSSTDSKQLYVQYFECSFRYPLNK